MNANHTIRILVSSTFSDLKAEVVTEYAQRGVRKPAARVCGDWGLFRGAPQRPAEQADRRTGSWTHRATKLLTFHPSLVMLHHALQYIRRVKVSDISDDIREDAFMDFLQSQHGGGKADALDASR
jgi:hypothetical protein